uniref:GH18 domain-containing protein n=1 Tax=Vitis vinifera TaxID=29760 RepID=F6GZ29_VITVI
MATDTGLLIVPSKIVIHPSPSMASNSIFLLLFSLLSLLHLHSSAAQSSVKAVYWFPDNEFPASNIDSTLFTHLFCAFADVDPTTYQVTVASQNTNAFSTFTTTVQQKNPSVKTFFPSGEEVRQTSRTTSLPWLASLIHGKLSLILQ